MFSLLPDFTYLHVSLPPGHGFPFQKEKDVKVEKSIFGFKFTLDDPTVLSCGQRFVIRPQRLGEKGNSFTGLSLRTGGGH